MNVAIIPARGGSKRIPRKNIKNFLGVPIIAYSIRAALESNIFDRVIVSTDDNEIAQVALKYGAEVPFMRPKEISDDYAGTHEVMSHSVKFLLDSGFNPKNVCCIYATAPLIKSSDIKKGLKLLNKGKYKSVLSATSFSYPVQRSFYKRNDRLKMLFPENFFSRSQDLEEVFHDAGQFYWSSSEAWIGVSEGFNEHSSIVQLPSWRVQDIDNLDDWKHAELIYKVMNYENFK